MSIETSVNHVVEHTMILNTLHTTPCGQTYAINVPHGSSDSWILAQYALQPSTFKSYKTLCIVCDNALDANRLYDELSYLLDDTSLKGLIAVLPDWETLPYDPFSPHPDLISQRLATLYALSTQQTRIVIIPASTAIHRLAPVQFMLQHTFLLEQGQRLNLEAFKLQLSQAAYQHVSQVMGSGEFSVRGSLIDVYPMGSVIPYRIDLFDEIIDSIRTFDPDTQRSLYPVPNISVLPGKEYPFDDKARSQFRQRYRETFNENDLSKNRLYKDVGSGLVPAGLEYFLPLFFEDTATVFDYLPNNTQLMTIGDVHGAMNHFWTDLRERYAFLKADKERPIMAPDSVFMSSEGWFSASKAFSRIQINHHLNNVNNINIINNQHITLGESLPVLSIDRKHTSPLHYLYAFYKHCIDNDKSVIVMAESLGRQETLIQLLKDYWDINNINNINNINECIPLNIQRFKTLNDCLANINNINNINNKNTINIVVGCLSSGISFNHIVIITETELFALSPLNTAKKRRKQEKTNSIEAMIKDLAELHIGDPVVHSQHGVARYQGLITLDIDDGDTECLHLEFAHQQYLYVPVSHLQLISRYGGGNPDNAPLHSLGSQQWDKARQKAAEQARDTAAELLDIYAKRALREGFAFDLDLNDYADFKDGFGFNETPDQAAAIEAVINDMTSNKPMDRLVCGDVGFGKTEVALRAAFVAVMGGKQVAILAPTTLLSEQHYETFKNRFAAWPVEIAELSRFKTTKEINASVKLINEGKIDIIIGTHKLFSSGVHYPRLGLVIIDEEHRFGVRHKEALKALRAEVDILTLTATPIPRTLGMSLEGLRDLSVIATAPERRLAIKTFVRSESNSVIREAVLRELKRGGQVYFLHNEVETILNRKAALELLLPEARIAVAHGQMPERELERVMRDFYQQRFNVLLCTTIIETGIDVSTANTIIMHRADKFGLAQLHQLRGRVGRSHHQAYAYLLVHSLESLTTSAKQRLEAIQSMEELGSGFYLAMHDLEIRGAGEVLGEHQSGEVAQIGFRLYIDMINNAVKALKQGKQPHLNDVIPTVSEVKLHAPALLPAMYVPDVHQRLTIYKQLASAETESALRNEQESLIDRYGLLPDPAITLINTHLIRITMNRLGISKIDAYSDGFVITVNLMASDSTVKSINIDGLMQLLHKHPKTIKLHGQDKLKVSCHTDNPLHRAEEVLKCLKQLASL